MVGVCIAVIGDDPTMAQSGRLATLFSDYFQISLIRPFSGSHRIGRTENPSVPVCYPKG